MITCSDSGGATELVRDGVTGLVVEPQPQALGAAIDRLWSDRHGVKRMGDGRAPGGAKGDVGRV